MADEGTPPAGAGAPPERETPAKVPPQLQALVKWLPDLSLGAWHAVVVAAGSGSAGLSKETTMLLASCGLIEGTDQLLLVEQAAFLRRQSAKAGSPQALRERLAPLGFNAQHIDVLSGSGILHIAVELAYSAPDTVELELTSTSTVGALKGLLHEREGVLPAAQRLLFGGEPLADESATLEESGVGDGASVTLETDAETPRSSLALSSPRSSLVSPSPRRRDGDEDDDSLSSDDDDDDEFSASPTSSLRWLHRQLTRMGCDELKALLRATARHLAGHNMAEGDLDAVESAMAAADLEPSHTPRLTKILAAAITEYKEEAEEGDDAREPYPLGEGHAELIASAASWFASNQPAERKQRAAEGRELGHVFGCKSAGWLRVEELEYEREYDEDEDEDEEGEGAAAGSVGVRRWFVLRQTCLEVFPSPSDADRGVCDSSLYSMIPIGELALPAPKEKSEGGSRMAALRRKGQAALEEDAFVMRIIRLESVVGNPLPKSLTCHAADLEGCKRWVEALQAEAIGEEVSMAKAAGSKAAAAKDAAKGKAAAAAHAAHAKEKAMLAAAHAKEKALQEKASHAAHVAKEKAREKADAAAHSVEEARKHHEEAKEEKRAAEEAKKAADLALARENDAKRRREQEEKVLAQVIEAEKYYMYMRHHAAVRKGEERTEAAAVRVRLDRARQVFDLFGESDAEDWKASWTAQQEDEEDAEAAAELFAVESWEVEADDAGHAPVDLLASDSESDDEPEVFRHESSESESEEEEEELRQREDAVHVQFGGKGKFESLNMKLEAETLVLSAGETERRATVTACQVGVPKKARKGAPTKHQLRLDLAEGVADDKGCSKYIICVESAVAAEEWKQLLQPAHTSEYSLFTVEQTHLASRGKAKRPKVVTLGVNASAVAVMEPNTLKVYEKYRFFKLKGWKADAQQLTLRVMADESFHGFTDPLTTVRFGTSRATEICDLMKSIALAIAATKKREKWREQALAAGKASKIEVGRCQFGGKGEFQPVTMELAGDRFTMECHLGALTRLSVAKVSKRFTFPRQTKSRVN